MTSARAHPELMLPSGDFLGAALHRRLDTVREAIAWPRGLDTNQQLHHSVWQRGGLSICLAKPGKETQWTGERSNPNDMLPCVCRGGHLPLLYKPTFSALWGALEAEVTDDLLVGELVGSLFVRAAYLLDCSELDHGIWRYAPPQPIVDVIDSIVAEVPLIIGRVLVDRVPFEAFLHFIDALALNEDVKYYTLPKYGETRLAEGIGRTNNLLTGAHLVAVAMRRMTITGFLGRLGWGSGVAPLTLDEAQRAFPQLRPANAL